MGNEMGRGGAEGIIIPIGAKNFAIFRREKGLHRDSEAKTGSLRNIEVDIEGMEIV